MSGLSIIVPGNFGATGWAAGDALIRQQFVGDADRAFVFDARYSAGLFQDRAGTIPVTELGQPVHFIADRSGQGRDAVLREGATGIPTWRGEGAMRWIEIPLASGFDIAAPMRHTDWTVVGAIRLDGVSSGTSYPIVSQRGPASNAYMVIQISRLAGKIALNLHNNGGHELLGEDLALGRDYYFNARKDIVGLTASVQLAGGVVSPFSGPMSVPNGNATTDQGVTQLFCTAENSVSVSGRLYYLAFTRALRDTSALEGIAARRIGQTG